MKYLFYIEERPFLYIKRVFKNFIQTSFQRKVRLLINDKNKVCSDDRKFGLVYNFTNFVSMKNIVLNKRRMSVQILKTMLQ
jgi:hypothetical protein